MGKGRKRTKFLAVRRRVVRRRVVGGVQTHNHTKQQQQQQNNNNSRTTTTTTTAEQQQQQQQNNNNHTTTTHKQHTQHKHTHTHTNNTNTHTNNNNNNNRKFGQNTKTLKLAKVGLTKVGQHSETLNWPKSVWPKSVKPTIGQSRSKNWAKSDWQKLAKVGHDLLEVFYDFLRDWVGSAPEVDSPVLTCDAPVARLLSLEIWVLFLRASCVFSLICVRIFARVDFVEPSSTLSCECSMAGGAGVAGSLLPGDSAPGLC